MVLWIYLASLDASALQLPDLFYPHFSVYNLRDSNVNLIVTWTGSSLLML
jgi:hypothetical protein